MPDAAEETTRLAAALESAPGTDEAISFEGMMAVVEGRDPISQLMESSRKLDRHGLLDRIEGLGWRLYGITERARRTAAASHSEGKALQRKLELLGVQYRQAKADGAWAAQEMTRLNALAASPSEELESWDGLMEQLDRHYPADLMANWPDDPGPRIVALIRQIDAIRQEAALRTTKEGE